MTDACLWCGTNDVLVSSHALKKRSLGGKETIRLCSPCDLWFDERNARLVREGDFLVGYDNDGNRLGAVPAEPTRFSVDLVLLGPDAPAALDALENAALRADEDSLFGTVAVVWQAVDRGGWPKRVLCYAIKVRYGWREQWASVAADRIDALSGTRLAKAQIYQYARDWEILRTELSERSEALLLLKPTVLSLISRARDVSGLFPDERARARAADFVLENPGLPVRQLAALLQKHRLLPQDESLWGRLRRAAFANDREALEVLQAEWIQSEWYKPELLALHGDIGCFVLWAAGKSPGGKP